MVANLGTLDQSALSGLKTVSGYYNFKRAKKAIESESHLPITKLPRNLEGSRQVRLPEEQESIRASSRPVDKWKTVTSEGVLGLGKLSFGYLCKEPIAGALKSVAMSVFRSPSFVAANAYTALNVSTTALCIGVAAHQYVQSHEAGGVTKRVIHGTAVLIGLVFSVVGVTRGVAGQADLFAKLPFCAGEVMNSAIDYGVKLVEQYPE